MNWRRGLLLAGVHLLVTVPAVVREEMVLWPYLRATSSHPSWARLQSVTIQEDQTVAFMPDPCDLWRARPESVDLVFGAEMPAVLLSGWTDRCRPLLPLGRLFARIFGVTSKRADVAAAISVCVLVVGLWLLVGGFPLFRTRTLRWLDPGLFITVCLAIGVVGLLFPGPISYICAKVAVLGWLYWVFAALANAIRSGLARFPRG